MGVQQVGLPGEADGRAGLRAPLAGVAVPRRLRKVVLERQVEEARSAGSDGALT